jgi:hypothetical protein
VSEVFRTISQGLEKKREKENLTYLNETLGFFFFFIYGGGFRTSEEDNDSDYRPIHDAIAPMFEAFYFDYGKLTDGTILPDRDWQVTGFCAGAPIESQLC